MAMCLNDSILLPHVVQHFEHSMHAPPRAIHNEGDIAHTRCEVTEYAPAGTQTQTSVVHSSAIEKHCWARGMLRTTARAEVAGVVAFVVVGIVGGGGSCNKCATRISGQLATFS